MASWNSKYAIWKDLSLVQGTVPAEIDYTVAHGERPPRVPIVEETEEHFYSSYCNGNVASISAPDINLISKMLAEVGQVDPEDVQIKEQEVPSTRSFRTNMFVRKKKTASTENSPALSPTQEPTADTDTSVSKEQPQSFVPTPRAARYYMKFYERSKDLEKKKETIWDRLERQIKEIDEKRKLMTEEGEIYGATTEAEETHSATTKAEKNHRKPAKRGPQGIDRVRLAEHRHKMLTDVGGCVVCAALNKAYPTLVRGDNPTPLDSTQIDSTPLELTPLDSTPLESTPLDSTPRDSTPRDSTPRDSTPRDSTPLDSTPRDSMPHDSKPLDSTPLDSMPLDSTPRDSMPLDSTPLDSMPLDSTPFEPAPCGSTLLCDSVLLVLPPVGPPPHELVTQEMLD